MIKRTPSSKQVSPIAASFRPLAVVFMATLLSACQDGGGGSTDEPSNDDNPDPTVSESDSTKPAVDPETLVIETQEPLVTTTGPVVETSEPVVTITDPVVETPPPTDPMACDADTQKQWAYDALRDYYLFSDQIADVDPSTYDSTRDVVRSLRFEERDPYSSVSDAATSSLILEEGREFGLGYGWAWDKANVPRLAFVFKESPFGNAGLERGDIILSVDGLSWTSDELDEGFGDRVFGTPDNPSTAVWQFQKNDTGDIVSASITAAQFKVNTVLAAEVISNTDWPNVIGYLAFKNFLGTSEEELKQEFEFFRDSNINELILDLRYNGGGLISQASLLASLIADNTLAERTLYEYRFNDKYTVENFNLDFQTTDFGLGLSRVIALTSPNTASASEIVIAGLRPYVEVVTIGKATNGKPYISSGNDRCGERLNLMMAEGFNAENVSVFGGIEANCYAADDLTRNFGLNVEAQEVEGMLNAGIDYILDERNCATAPVEIAARSKTSGSGVGSLDNRQGTLTVIDGAVMD